MPLLAFADFVPEQRVSQRRRQAPDGTYSPAHITESLASLLRRANDAIAAHQWRVVNVETLTLPSTQAASLAEYRTEVRVESWVVVIGAVVPLRSPADRAARRDWLSLTSGILRCNVEEDLTQRSARLYRCACDDFFDLTLLNLLFACSQRKIQCF